MNCSKHLAHNSADEVSLTPFGYGSHIDSGWHLLLAFGVVALYMTVCGACLNNLESLTYGTSYHLMLQRIYREIMMVGLAAFAYTILNATDVDMPISLYRAFGFADICSFIMAFFFCVQGIFIMIGSVRQSRIWDAVADMTTEELQLSFSSMLNSSNIFTLSPYYPFSAIRDKVEFRIFNAIFSSTYSISTKNSEFDFGMFLRKSHEENILSIIEIGPEKWLLILIITIVPMLRIDFYDFHCNTIDCRVAEEIYLCVMIGFVNFLLSMFLFWCGRHSELLLLRKTGVYNMHEYVIFLGMEVRTRVVSSRNKVASTMVKDAITEYLVENESIAASKRASARSNMRRQSAVAKARVMKVIGVESWSGRVKIHADSMNSTDCVAGSNSLRCQVPDGPQSAHAVSLSSLEEGKLAPILGAIKAIDKAPQPTPQEGTPARSYCEVESFHDDEAKTAKGGLSQSLRDAHPNAKKLIVRRTSTAGENFVVETTDMEVVPLESSRHDTLQGHTASESAPPAKSNEADMKKHRAATLRGAVRKSILLVNFTSSAKMTYKEKLKNIYEKENFSDIFLLGSSRLYYGLMSVVITANSLYLAWWITNFIMLIFRLKSAADIGFLLVISALPPLATFPFLYLAIKSSTILKALCRLNLDIVAAVVEKTESNSALKKNFRSLYLSLATNRVDARPELRELFHKHSTDGISMGWDEFQEMVIASQIHFSQAKLRYLYDCMRPAPTREVTSSVRPVVLPRVPPTVGAAIFTITDMFFCYVLFLLSCISHWRNSSSRGMMTSSLCDERAWPRLHLIPT